MCQLPHEVLDGMKVSTIYEARPYITGCTSGRAYVDGSYDIDSLYSQPAARTPAGSTTTAAMVENANPDDWYYYNPYERMNVYEDLSWYDYYLVRGFAVVECGGLGTKGSDGFETCGTDLEQYVTTTSVVLRSVTYCLCISVDSVFEKGKKRSGKHKLIHRFFFFFLVCYI